MKDLLFKLIIGKNLPHFARWLATGLGAILLTGPLFSPKTEALDAGLGPAAVEIGAPSADQVQDGMTVGELMAALGGTALIWSSRFISWMRARNLTGLARLIGPLIGRSIPSALRALMVIIAGALARFTAQPEIAPDVLAGMPVANVIGSVLLVMFANLMSATEDAKRNPVRQSLSSHPDWEHN